ncbi:hypothetical protein [Vulgatibacter sp.]|uniref:hypothetical protein n=1 Tax=Vulgatibacter sp. TaxID=1971226 RepID=UPI00356B4028
MSRQTSMQIWGMPLLLGGASVLGLVVALLGDGLADATSWLALGAPALIGCWFPFRRTGARTGAAEPTARPSGEPGAGPPAAPGL